MLLPEGKKRTKLGSWLESELLPAFASRVLPLGEAEMNEWVALQADAEKRCRPFTASLKVGGRKVG